jgi:hypothetical protein
MFDALSERLRKTLGSLTGRGRVSEADVDAAMREVRLALLEADVNFKVVKDFIARVRERAIGANILESLTAGQQVVSIVNEELVALLSAGDRTFHLSAIRPWSCWSACRARARPPRPPSSPAHCVKLGRRPLLVAADPYRRPPPTSSRPWASLARRARSTAPPPAPRSWRSPRPASRPPAGRRATWSSSTPPAGSRSTRR